MNTVEIKCTNEQALNIYEKKCLNGHECDLKKSCDGCPYFVENVEFIITDRN